MAKQIPLGDIPDYLQESIRLVVNATTLEAEGRLKKATPVDTGRLRNNWQSETVPPGSNKFEAAVINNVEYAEPNIYGTALPPSWKGEYRTRQGTIPGFPDLIAKELESWAQGKFQKILRRA